MLYFVYYAIYYETPSICPPGAIIIFMNIEYILGFSVSILALCVILLGLTGQIYKNYKEKRSGMSIIIIGFGIILLFLRIIYTYIRHDYFIMIPDIISFFIHVVLIYQFIIYKK